MKKIWVAALFSLIVFSFSTVAHATTVIDVESPANWRLQDYLGGIVIVYFTSAPSPCVNGALTFPGTVTQDEINRFWSLVLTAKTTGSTVGLTYESTTCVIDSFFATP